MDASSIRRIRASLFSSAVAVGLFIGPELRAADIWTHTGAQIDEVVANDRTIPPPSPVQPLAAQVPFSNFRYPHVDVNEDVTFIADDPASGGKGVQHGIYRSIAKTGELKPLLRAYESAAPGTTLRLDWFRGLQVDGPDFVFNATDSKGSRGLYHWSGGTIRTIVRSGMTTLPGVGQPVTDVEYGSLSAGRIIYAARAGEEKLLVLHELDSGKSRVLCRSGMDIPNRNGAQFKYFSTINWIDGQNIVFRAADIAKPHETGPTKQGHYGIYAWLDIDWAKPDEAFAPSRLTTLADSSTNVPLIEKAQFHDFRSAPVRNGMVAFSASGPKFNGIYFCDLKTKDHSVQPVVDTQSALRGLFDGSFTDFDIYCSIVERNVVFIGRAADSYVGVFLYRTDTGELFVLCDNRTPIEGKQVNNFEIAGDFMVRNRFAVTAHFEDKTSGVYLATIPSWSFRRISGSK